MLKKYGAITKSNPLNILTCPTHERYESNLCKLEEILPVRFYAYRSAQVKDWNSNYAPLPPNYFLLNGAAGEKQLPKDVEFDLALSQNKFGQFQILFQLANKLKIPMISLEHTLPMPNWDEKVLEKLRQMRGTLNLFISEYSRAKWGWSEQDAAVIHHGIDTTVFQGDPEATREPHVLSVVNDWINRDQPCGFKLWAQTVQGKTQLPIRVLGDTPGLSKPAESVSHLVSEYGRAQIFLNTSQVSPIPTALMEAAACGCACVSTSNCMIPEIFTHGENALLANTPEELRKHCEYLLKNENERVRLGKNAQRTIQERFTLDRHLQLWASYLKLTLGI